MISRRNIRVKVMQLIYSMETMDELNDKSDPVKTLRKKLDQSEEMFIYLLFFLTEVARYAEKDAKAKAAKNLPTNEDLNVNIKIAGNELLWQILDNSSFKKAAGTYKPQLIKDESLVRKIYNNLTVTDEYKNYINVQGRDKKGEKEIIKFIFTDMMLPNEEFVSFMEENFTNWDDDAEMMSQLILNFLQKPSPGNSIEMVSPEKWEFAKDLLTTTINKKDYVTDIIKPKLRNWDAERIAILDMIMMQMGVCELLYFETIPPKVTINEYIDIAKEYSTSQSGHFINGILDNIHKELMAQGKIHKVDFRQKAS